MDEFRVLRVGANIHPEFEHLAVAHHADHAPQFERDRRPLVFLDAAVIVGLKERHAFLFIERHGADVDARRIQMRGRQRNAVLQALLADDRQDDRLFRLMR